MDPEPEVIRHQIDETRSSLAEKLETLEHEVMGTVESAKETVQDTIDSVKESVHDTITSARETMHDTVESVKQTFDVPLQVERHPFTMVGLSLVSGLALGALLGGRRTRDIPYRMSEASEVPGPRREMPPAAAWSRPESEHFSAKPSFLDRLTGQVGGEFEKIKDLAITTLVGVVREMGEKAVPALKENVEHMLSDAAAHFTAPNEHNQPAEACSDFGAHQPYRQGGI